MTNYLYAHIQWTLENAKFLPYYSTLIIVLLWLALGWRENKSLRLPRIGKNPHRIFGLAKARSYFLHNGRRLVEEGYAKYKDSKYIVQTADMERIIISNKYVDELKSLPASILDNVAAQCERHLAWWTTLDVVKHSNLQTDVCRNQLNQNLGPVVLNMADEACHGIRTQFARILSGECDSIQEAAFPLAMQLTTHTVNRVLVGLPICRDDRWIQTSMNYAINAFSISAALRPRSVLVRPFVHYFLDARLRLKANRKDANDLLVPIIEEMKDEKTDEKLHNTLLYWMVKNAQGADKDSCELVHKSLFLSLASIQSSVLAITHFLFDICAYPEYMEPLRQEIDEAIGENGGWNVKALYAMQRLDSFLKESLRINHPGLFSFNRKVMQRISLKDGTHLPSGSFISVPTYSLARDEQYYTDPLSFKPFRFYEMRQRGGDDQKRHQFASTSLSNLQWGYGRAACPGRVFAACEIKLMCALLISQFDVRFPNGQTQRPENVYIDERITPSKTQEIVFQARRV